LLENHTYLGRFSTPSQL